MTDKERLQDIKNRFMKHEYDYALSGDDVVWLIQQAELAKQLEEENDELAERVHKLALDWSELVDERNRYKQALEFYADEDNYCVSFEDDFEPILQDNGKIAKQALEG